jgi:hypothetical protein
MQVRVLRHALLGGVAALPSLGCAGVSLVAQADLLAPPPTLVCVISSLTITAAPLNLSTLFSGVQVTYTVSGSGVCEGTSSNTAFSISGQAVSWPGTPGTCADVAGAGVGTINVGAIPYNGTLAVAQPGSGGVSVLTMQTFLAPNNMSSVFDLVPSPASLQACVTGSSGTMNYTGAGIIVISSP